MVEKIHPSSSPFQKQPCEGPFVLHDCGESCEWQSNDCDLVEEKKIHYKKKI
jgi:hypothetical protein